MCGDASGCRYDTARSRLSKRHREIHLSYRSEGSVRGPRRTTRSPLPGVEIELELSDGFVDLVGEGIDLAIRIGDLPDTGLKARRLATSWRVVFAATSYLAKHGRPRKSRRPQTSPMHRPHHDPLR
jgi:DNA-binding transcriptional LysR family regulator